MVNEPIKAAESEPTNTRYDTPERPITRSLGPRTPEKTETDTYTQVLRMLKWPSDDSVTWSIMHLERMGAPKAQSVAQILRNAPKRGDAPPPQRDKFYEEVERAVQLLRQ